MSQAADNPYAYQAMKNLPQGPEPTIHYMEAYQFVFNNPNWLTNLLLVFVALIIPAIGPIIMVGYMMMVVHALHFRTTPTYPDFDFARFSDYLMRGLWPFVANLILAFCIVPLFMILVFVPMVAGGLASAADPTVGAIVFFIAFAIAFVGYLALIFAAQFIMPYLLLRASWTEDLMEGLNFSAGWDYASKMWVEILLEGLFLTFTAMIVAMIGMLACGVGYLIAISLIIYAQHHFLAQNYALYLARGGQPIPIKSPHAFLPTAAYPMPQPIHYGPPGSDPRFGPGGNPPNPYGPQK